MGKMISMKSMASMVRTYMMLCIAGLVVTCILMVLYRREGADKNEVNGAADIRHYDDPSPFRNIKGANSDHRPSNVKHREDMNDEEIFHDKEDDVGDDISYEDSEDDEAFGGIEDDGDGDGRVLEDEGDEGIWKDVFHDPEMTNNIPDGAPPNVLTVRTSGANQVDRAPNIGAIGSKGTDKVSPWGGTQNGLRKLTDGATKMAGGAEGTRSMTNMRIAGSKVKVTSRLEAGVQDLLRHPEEHIAKASIPKCTPKNDIVMMKTHKCSSSTMQNILFRWGEDHNLTFAFPRSGVYFGSPNLFSRQWVLPANGGHYNILANHMRFSDEVKQLMPADSVYIGLLRDPSTQYESMYTYYRYDARYKVPLDTFLLNPQTYFYSEPPFSPQAGRNPMLYDMGFDARYTDAEDPKVQAYIDHIIATFDLVLIAEYFKESLILMRDMLCWSTDDITFFNQNARSASSVQKLSPSTKQRVLQWNSADNRLYQHFNRTLWQKVDAFGRERMASEIAELDSKNKELASLCIGGTRQAGDKRMWYPSGINVKSFVLSSRAQGNQLCSQMTRPELTYLNHLKNIQKQRETGR